MMIEDTTVANLLSSHADRLLIGDDHAQDYLALFAEVRYDIAPLLRLARAETYGDIARLEQLLDGSRHASRLDVERGGDWLRCVGCRCSGLSLAQPQRQWGAAFADTIETRNRVSRRNPVSFLFPAPYFAHARASSTSVRIGLADAPRG